MLSLKTSECNNKSLVYHGLKMPLIGLLHNIFRVMKITNENARNRSLDRNRNAQDLNLPCKALGDRPEHEPDTEVLVRLDTDAEYALEPVTNKIEISFKSIDASHSPVLFYLDNFFDRIRHRLVDRIWLKDIDSYWHWHKFLDWIRYMFGDWNMNWNLLDDGQKFLFVRFVFGLIYVCAFIRFLLIDDA